MSVRKPRCRRRSRRALTQYRNSSISKLYAELAKSGGKGGRPLAVPTVQHVHRSLRKALNDAVMIDAVMSSNPT